MYKVTYTNGQVVIVDSEIEAFDLYNAAMGTADVWEWSEYLEDWAFAADGYDFYGEN